MAFIPAFVSASLIMLVFVLRCHVTVQNTVIRVYSGTASGGLLNVTFVSTFLPVNLVSLIYCITCCLGFNYVFQ